MEQTSINGNALLSRGFECVHCEPCSVLSGWGGAGAYSDGKLTLSTEVGGWLNQYVSTKELEGLVKYVDGIYIKFGASEQVYGGDNEQVDEIDRQASLAGLKAYQARSSSHGHGQMPRNAATDAKSTKQQNHF